MQFLLKALKHYAELATFNTTAQDHLRNIQTDHQ